MGNITAHEEGNYTSTLIRPSKDTEPIFLFTFSLNVFLSITASVGNILILIALYKVSSLHPPTKLLFRSLAVTDLCVGLVSQPLFAIVLLYLSHTTDINSSVPYLVFTAANGSGFVFCEASIMVSTAIRVDRLLALLLGLRYRHVVTLMASSCNCNSFMVTCYFGDISGLFLELPFFRSCSFKYCFSFFGHVNLFLHKYLP